MSYPYINKTGALRSFLKEIPKLGIPEKVSQNYLSSIGFKSSGDRPIINVLKFIGFLESSGVPTQQYKDF